MIYPVKPGDMVEADIKRLNAQVAALKVEMDKLKYWCRKLIESGTFPGEAEGLRAELESLRAHNKRLQKWIDDVNEPEFEAVKAERDDLKRQLTALPIYDPSYGDAVVLISDLKTERDKLFEENGKLAAVYAERDRLRAALEQIIEHYDTNEADAIARRALEGK
jgi:regulator of replication initiation timing